MSRPLPCDSCQYRTPVSGVASQVGGLRALLWSVRHGFTHTQAMPHVHAHKPLAKHVLVCTNADCAARGSVPLVTSLRRSASLLCLNVALGDRGDLSERRCGCPLERVGWRRHLSGIRSYEKLTGGGVTFYGTEVIRILEHVLPAEFGGAPTDYQLVEEEHETGSPLLTLRVHPSIGTIDEARLTEEGAAKMAAIGIDVAGLRGQRRPVCRTCLDWSERRSHLSGSLGEALLARFIETGWARRSEDSRAIHFTPKGERQFLEIFPLPERI